MMLLIYWTWKVKSYCHRSFCPDGPLIEVGDAVQAAEKETHQQFLLSCKYCDVQY